MELNSLHNLDYFYFLKKVPDNFCDLVCIDPPYFINYNSNDWDKIDKAEETFDNIFRESYRVLKTNGTLKGDSY